MSSSYFNRAALKRIALKYCNGRFERVGKSFFDRMEAQMEYIVRTEVLHTEQQQPLAGVLNRGRVQRRAAEIASTCAPVESKDAFMRSVETRFLRYMQSDIHSQPSRGKTLQ